MCKCAYKYCVILYFEVIDIDTDVLVDCYSDVEYYDTFSEASERASFLRERIGDGRCSWSDAIEILKDVYFDDTPRVIQDF